MNELYKKILTEVKTTNQNQKSKNSRVLVIDGLNTFIRTWTTNPTMNEDGDHIGGLTGFLKSIGFQIKMFNPSRVIVVFDGKGGNDKRKEIYEGYKAGREDTRFRVNRQYGDLLTPDEERLSMKQQFVWLHDVLGYLPITKIISDNIEADDVIGYIASSLTKNCEDNEEVIIVSTDKDFLQLVDERVKVYSPSKKKLYDREQVFEDFGIWPQNILLYRIVDGDKSDNIEGLKGCGLKTLIKRFPQITEDRKVSIEDFISYSSERKDSYKLYSTIVENKDTIYRNERLMKLSQEYINDDIKQNIDALFYQPNNPFVKTDFIKVGMKYKMLQNWKGVDNWIHDVFKNIIVK